MRFEDLAVGQSAERSHRVTDDDVIRFAEVSGDFNPLHLDEAVAKRSMFGARIAHGMLLGAYISAVLGMDLPGPGAVYLSQSLRFIKPVRLGDTIITRLEITELVTEKRRVRLKAACTNQDGIAVIEGEALMMILP